MRRFTSLFIAIALSFVVAGTAYAGNTKFRYMQADMYNLVPAVGEINCLRSNYGFGMIPGEKRGFGTCDIEIENRKAEPRPETRGNIARMYFYMDWAYPGHGTNQIRLTSGNVNDTKGL